MYVSCVWPHYLGIGTGLLYLFFYLLCYAAVLKFLTYYAQYYAHVKNCAYKLTVLLEYIHLYQKVIFCVVSVLLEYIKFIIRYCECSIRVYRSLLIFLTKQFLLCRHYAFRYLLCSKLCWHNRPVPTKERIYSKFNACNFLLNLQ